MVPQAELIPVTASEVAFSHHAIVTVYRAAFALPPYSEGEEDVERFAERLLRHTQFPGFRCVVAREVADGAVVGFAYGYAMRRDHWFAGAIGRELDGDMARTWLTDAFELLELAVEPRARRRGIGGRLHDSVLANVPHRTAILTTAQADTPALRLYRKRGWVTLIENFRFLGDDTPHRIMGLRRGNEPG